MAMDLSSFVFFEPYLVPHSIFYKIERQKD